MTRGPARTPIVQRLLRRTVKDGDCWLVVSTLQANGYAAVYTPGPPEARLMAHRVVFEHFRGAITDGLEIDHLCQRRNCINPAHLEPVTHAENLRRASDRLWATRETCARGHPLPEAGIRRDRNGRPRCATCYRENNRKKATA